MKNIAVIDTEGIVSSVGGCGKYKTTTCYIRLVNLLIGDPTTEKLIVNKKWIVALPIKFESLPEKVKKQWRYTHRIHKQYWGQDGIKYESLLKIIREMLLIYNVEKIYAKGKLLEDRFLNKGGMYGETICYREWKYDKKTLRITDLNNYGVEKFDKHLFELSYFLENANFLFNNVKNLFKWAGKRIKEDSLLRKIIIYNYKNGLPCPHDPEEECKYFFTQIIEKKIK